MNEVSLEMSDADLTASATADQLIVLAETAYPEKVASSRVRIANFVPFVRSHGIVLTYYPALTDAGYDTLASPGRVSSKIAALSSATIRSVVRKRPEHDLLLVHRLRVLNPLPGFDPPRRLDIYDIDDPLFLPFSGGVNQRFRWAKQERRRCIDCLRRARLVLVGNSYLADHAREHARRVEVLPSCVDATRQPLHVHHREEQVTVGWIGSSTTSPYLRYVLPVFDRLNAVRIRAKLILVGADRSIDAPWIEHRAWSLASEREDLAAFDIGIMPQPDDEWARGKCGYKVLQYFAAGVPAVASPVGVTRELIGSERGVLAASADDWYRALVSLIEDPAQRAEQGAAGRQFVERHYAYQRWAPELARLWRSVGG
jgi:glycosyltransferase involved in cell wall biosynthesis